MRCDRCHCNEATIIIDANLNGGTVSLHLCQECANAGMVKNVTFPPEMSGLLQNLAVKALDMANGSFDDDQQEDGEELICGHCGLTMEDFRQRQRLGCETCYVVFADEIADLLPRLHRGLTHQGSRPGDAPPKREDRALSRDVLLAELSEAIAAEAFEQAAELRDRLKHMDCLDGAE